MSTIARLFVAQAMLISKTCLRQSKTRRYYRKSNLIFFNCDALFLQIIIFSSDISSTCQETNDLHFDVQPCVKKRYTDRGKCTWMHREIVKCAWETRHIACESVQKVMTCELPSICFQPFVAIHVPRHFCRVIATRRCNIFRKMFVPESRALRKPLAVSQVCADVGIKNLHIKVAGIWNLSSVCCQQWHDNVNRMRINWNLWKAWYPFARLCTRKTDCTLSMLLFADLYFITIRYCLTLQIELTW